MRDIDTPALERVAPSLGIGNPATATRNVLFDDENLQQVLNVAGQVSRAVFADGIYFALMENIHGAADSTESMSINVYDDPAGTVCAPGLQAISTGVWPTPVPEGIDAWVLGAHALLSSGAAANFDGAALTMSMPGRLGAWGCSSITPGNAVAPRICTWDGNASLTLNETQLTQAGTGRVWVPLMLRIPRGASLAWFSRNQNATAIQAQLRLLIGLARTGARPDFAL